MMDEKNKKITIRGGLWNTASGMINAGQSAVILIFISACMGIEAAGVFSIAYAVANLLMTVAKYGIRNYQVTDVAEKYTFQEYLVMRMVTVTGTFIFLLFYLWYKCQFGGYSLEKAVVVCLIVVWKFIDAMEDVYYGMYQQRGRLDIGAKAYTIRLLFSTLVYCVLIVAGCAMSTATGIMLLLSVVCACAVIRHSISNFAIADMKVTPKNVLRLLYEGLPLCIGTSLSIYIGNLPKYLIDSYMDEKVQAYFGFIMMPAFVIVVLNNFIYQPIIRGLAEFWENGQKKQFKRRILKQYMIVLGLTGIVVVAGAFLGIPVLSFLYSVDLFAYKLEFIILLMGGGLYALASFIMVPITIIRFQKCIAIGFVLASAVSLLLGRYLVIHYGIFGASVLYLFINAFIAAYLTICLIGKMNLRRV